MCSLALLSPLLGPFCAEEEPGAPGGPSVGGVGKPCHQGFPPSLVVGQGLCACTCPEGVGTLRCLSLGPRLVASRGVSSLSCTSVAVLAGKGRLWASPHTKNKNNIDGPFLFMWGQIVAPSSQIETLDFCYLKPSANAADPERRPSPMAATKYLCHRRFLKVKIHGI